MLRTEFGCKVPSGHQQGMGEGPSHLFGRDLQNNQWGFGYFKYTCLQFRDPICFQKQITILEPLSQQCRRYSGRILLCFALLSVFVVFRLVDKEDFAWGSTEVLFIQQREL